MNEERILQVLAGAAHGEAPPAVDVADRVLASLRVRRQPSRLIVWFATAASAAAMILVVLAVYALLHPAAAPVGDGFDAGLVGML